MSWKRKTTENISYAEVLANEERAARVPKDERVSGHRRSRRKFSDMVLTLRRFLIW